MQSKIKKLVLSNFVSLMILPAAFAVDSAQSKPPVQENADVMYWDDLLPKLDLISADYDLPLQDIMDEYFPEYDGENYVKCMDSEDKHNSRNQDRCDSLSNDLDKKECHAKNDERHERAVGQCHDVGKSENETQKGSNSGGSSNDIRVALRDIVFGKKK